MKENTGERGNARDQNGAALVLPATIQESARAHGIYLAVCTGPLEHERDAYVKCRDAYWHALHNKHFTAAQQLKDRLDAFEIEEKWRDTIENLVVNVGKDDMLDTYFDGSAYTAVIVMGLKGTGTVVAGDTQASHSGWLEVGGANAPVYTGNRPTPSFAAASGGSKSTSSAVNFAFTSAGTVAGCFINQGGSATKDNTTGMLVSAGDFTGGSKSPGNGDQLNVSYSMGL